ncbi:MAG: ion transporter [Oscillospiraceae bacterium]|nr:ion transporter [Oscillospiraceae bacterium]
MREKIKALVESPFFTTTIFILIVLNTLSLGVETFTLPAAANQALSVFNTVCITVFVLEILLKLYVYGVSFFKDGWNIFDVFIVAISIMPMIKFLSSMRAFRIFRMFRALRALRMMKRLEKLRIIVQALLGALPSVGWVVVLLLIIYYVFAVIGTNLFSTLSPEYFGTLWQSLYTLFQVTMADDLGNISRPLLTSGIGAVLYFISFVTLTSILVLNVIVGIVVDSMEEIKNVSRKNEQEESLSQENAAPALPTQDDNFTNADVLQEIENLELQLGRLKSMIAAKEQK